MSEYRNVISVIVPIYNVARYLDECIQSIVKQSYPLLEIILVDDGSTDNSGAICDSYATMDKRIKVVHKVNGGLSDARNTGLKIANGEWVAFVDSDDYISENALEIMFKSAIENKSQIAVCNMVRVFEDGEKSEFYCPSKELLIFDNINRFETLKQPSVCNKLFERDLFQGIEFPKGKYYEDTFVYHALVHRSTRIVLTGFDGYYYRSRRDSILGQPAYTDRYFDFVEAVYNRAKYLIENDIEYYAEEACLSLYVAVGIAEKNIPKNKSNRNQVKQMAIWYQLAYDHLMNSKNTGIKQKVRLVMLKCLPVLHNMIY